MSLTAAQLVVRVKADTLQAQQGLGGLAGMLGSGGLLGLGALAAAAAVAGIGIAATKMAGDFQQGMTTLVTGAGESQSNLKMVSDGILQMARDTGTSTSQLTAGMYMIESAGYHGADGLAVLKAASEGAKVGNADLGTVADATTTIMKDFANQHVTASQAVNTLVATVANGKTHMEDLAGALAQVLPTASAAHIGLNGVMAAMATMTGEGVPAANAATYLRQTMIALTAPGSAAKKALEGVGLSSADVAKEMQKSLPDALKMITDHVGKKFPEGSAGYVAAIKEISGGSREMQGMLDLTGSHMKDFNQNVKSIGGAVKQGGSQINGWSLVQQDFNQKLSVAGEVVQTLMIQLGTKLLPVAGQLADMFSQNLGPVVDALSGKTKGLSSGFGGDLFNAAKQVAGFFKTDVQPVMKQLGDLWTTTIVPIIHTFAEVLVKNVLPAIMPVADTIAKKWLPPMIRIYKDILPVLNPLLQAFGWIFQNIIGPVLGQVAGLIGAVLGKVADLADTIARFIQKPEVQSFIKLIGHAISSGPMAAVGNLFHSLPHFAGGGVMSSAGLALVGENGPELVQLPGGAQVYPNSALGSVGSVGASYPNPAGGGSGPAGGGSSAAQTTQPIILQVDGRTLARVMVKHLPGVVASATGNRSV